MIDILYYIEFAPVGITIGKIQVTENTHAEDDNFLHVMFTVYNLRK
jgi:hypothetical protein